MFVKTSFLVIIFVALILTTIECKKRKEPKEKNNAEKSPLLELPCMRRGGVCAMPNACPPGFKVGDIGLCPDQQELGMECCKPSGKVPFFELPCMLRGGTCALATACPPGTKVGKRGLCPEQQDYGMECCKPSLLDTRCKVRGGECIPKKMKCAKNLRVKDTNDCRPKEICCFIE